MMAYISGLDKSTHGEKKSEKTNKGGTGLQTTDDYIAVSTVRI